MSMKRNLVAAALTVLALAMGPTVSLAQEKFTIGAVLIDSGPMAAYYERSNNALKLAVDQINADGGINGRPLELKIATHAGTPEAAVSAAVRLRQHDGARIITGMTGSALAIALAARAKVADYVLFDPFSQTDILNGKNCHRNYFRVSTPDALINNGLEAVVATSPASRFDIIASDHPAGHDSAANFAVLLERHGKTSNPPIFVPAGTADMGSFIIPMKSSDADGALVAIFGTDAINFAVQQKGFGLFDKYKQVIGNGFATPATLASQGEGVKGVIQLLGWTPEIDTPENKAFVQAYRDAFGGDPDYVAADQYNAIQLIAAGLRAAGTDEAGPLVAALEGKSVATTFGPTEVRAQDHQLVRPLTVNEVIRNDDGSMGYRLERSLTAEEAMPAPSPDCALK
ncbi:ABC transporter substrate-binding protein [Paracoccus sp. FO-3]|uniref:ABC transporter substrate-binding protein n=1 Tax=Paracoccus sp. FO-3 TaxID=1335059 RepID=UPI0015E317B9|nr:ABC transporter substrate-binding protein [Paracoccus sp. FO-3]